MIKYPRTMWWDNNLAGVDERCCLCPSVAYILADNKKWYCQECIRERDALGQWADLVDLIEEASNEHPGAISLPRP